MDRYFWVSTRTIKPDTREQFEQSWRLAEFPDGLVGPKRDKVVGISIWDSAEACDRYVLYAEEALVAADQLGHRQGVSLQRAPELALAGTGPQIWNRSQARRAGRSSGGGRGRVAATGRGTRSCRSRCAPRPVRPPPRQAARRQGRAPSRASG
jgi:hypothetical protein